MSGQLDTTWFPWTKEPPPDTPGLSSTAEAAPASQQRKKPSWATKKPKSNVVVDEKPDVPKDKRANGPRIIVFCVGGVAHNEVVALKKLGDKMDREIYIGSNYLWQPDQFVESTKYLNRPGSRGDDFIDFKRPRPRAIRQESFGERTRGDVDERYRADRDERPRGDRGERARGDSERPRGDRDRPRGDSVYDERRGYDRDPRTEQRSRDPRGDRDYQERYGNGVPERRGSSRSDAARREAYERSRSASDPRLYDNRSRPSGGPDTRDPSPRQSPRPSRSRRDYEGMDDSMRQLNVKETQEAPPDKPKKSWFRFGSK